MPKVFRYRQYMKVKETITTRIIEPAAVRLLAWRGDPAAQLLSMGRRGDPYSLYEDVRRTPLLRSRLGLWVTADYATAVAVLRDRRFSSSPTHQPGYAPRSYPDGDPRAQLPNADMLTLDPPDHTRLRRLVSRAFSPSAIASLEPWIRQRADSLLDAIEPGGFDLIDAFAFPLPIGA
jgi:cytochrome P450